MKRIDISPFNYRWHRILEKNKYSGKFQDHNNPFFLMQEDVMMRVDKGHNYGLGFDVYKNAEIKQL